MSPFQRRAAQLSAALVVTVAGCAGKRAPPPPEPVVEPAPPTGGIQSKVTTEVRREGEVCVKYTSMECWAEGEGDGPTEPIACNPPPPKPVPCPPGL